MTALALEIAPDPAVPPAGRLRVLIADDHPLILAGIRRLIETHDDMHVVGEAHSGPELTDLIERERPDVVLMDLRMPGLNGVEAIELIRRRWPHTRAIVLSACDERGTIEAALEAGAGAYVLKSADAVDMASVVRRVAVGGVVAPEPVAAAAEEAPPATTTAVPAPLTERERSILSAVAAGKTTPAISRDLWVSEHTIKFHLTNIYRKLGVANRASAVRWALEHGVG